jgi:SNF2 family DNA or RNA helicase
MATTPTTTKPVTAEIAASGDSVLVTFPYNPAHVKAVKQVPSRRFVAADKPEGPAWRVDLDLDTMRRMREVFGDALGLGDELLAWGQRQVSQERNLHALSQQDDAKLKRVPKRMWSTGCKLPNGKRFKLRPYQRADVAFMAATNVINANQPRTGKTVTTIAAMMEADLEWGQHLIFAPLASLRNVWEDGIREAYACAGYDEPVVLTGDTPEQRRQAIAEAKQLADDGYAFWLVLNPAMARTVQVGKLDGKVIGRGTKALKKAYGKLNPRQREQVEMADELTHEALGEIDWDSITVDEFHLMGLSNPNTAGAKGVNEIAETTQPTKRFALSGTPMGGKPIKLWGALHFLDPEKFTSRWNWARHWLVVSTESHPGGQHSKIEGITPGREEDFYNHLKPYLVRRTQKEALPGLPPMNRINVRCGMTPKQQAQYVQFSTEAEWRIEDAEGEGRLTAANVLAEYARLKQFADGFCEVRRTGRETKTGLPEIKVECTADSGKVQQLVEKLMEENVIVSDSDDEDDPKCALVFSQFNSMVETVAEHLEQVHGVPVGIITGKTPTWKRGALATAFQTQQPVEAKVGNTTKTVQPPRVLVMNTKAGGTALTLDQAESVHVLDETWVPDDQEQAENRATPARKEQLERASTGAYYYRTDQTVEQYIQALVAGKAMNNRTILDLRRRMQKQLAAAEEAAA